MYVKIKDPEKAAFIRGVLIFLAVAGAAVLLLGPLYAHAGGLAELAADARDLAAKSWQKDKFKCVMVLLGLGMILFGLAVSVKSFLRKWKHWHDPKRVRALDFAPEGVYVISDLKILLPYNETALNMRVHIDSTYNQKHHTRKAYIKYVKLMFTWEKMSYTVTHLPTKKLLYALADMHARFAGFSFDTTMVHWDTREEKALSDHLRAQLENQVRYGLHCNYSSRFAPLVTAVILDVCATALAAWGFFNFSARSLINGATLVCWGGALVLFAAGGLYWVLAVREWNVSKEIARRSGMTMGAK